MGKKINYYKIIGLFLIFGGALFLGGRYAGFFAFEGGYGTTPYVDYDIAYCHWPDTNAQCFEGQSSWQLVKDPPPDSRPFKGYPTETVQVPTILKSATLNLAAVRPTRGMEGLGSANANPNIQLFINDEFVMELTGFLSLADRTKSNEIWNNLQPIVFDITETLKKYEGQTAKIELRGQHEWADIWKGSQGKITLSALCGSPNACNMRVFIIKKNMSNIILEAGEITQEASEQLEKELAGDIQSGKVTISKTGGEVIGQINYEQTFTEKREMSVFDYIIGFGMIISGGIVLFLGRIR